MGLLLSGYCLFSSQISIVMRRYWTLYMAVCVLYKKKMLVFVCVGDMHYMGLHIKWVLVTKELIQHFFKSPSTLYRLAQRRNGNAHAIWNLVTLLSFYMIIEFKNEFLTQFYVLYRSRTNISNHCYFMKHRHVTFF